MQNDKNPLQMQKRLAIQKEKRYNTKKLSKYRMKIRKTAVYAE